MANLLHSADEFGKTIPGTLTEDEKLTCAEEMLTVPEVRLVLEGGTTLLQPPISTPLKRGEEVRSVAAEACQL